MNSILLILYDICFQLIFRLCKCKCSTNLKITLFWCLNLTSIQKLYCLISEIHCVSCDLPSKIKKKKISMSSTSTKFVFFGPIGKTKWQPWPLIGQDIFDFFSDIIEWNSTIIERKQDVNILYHVCVFPANRKTRGSSWPLIGWDIFDFSSETTERNSMKTDRKQDLNVLYQVCVFRAERKNKMAVLASDW